MLLKTFLILVNLVALASCGTERIKSGDEIEDGNFSFTVVIGYDGSQVCTGVLVDRQWVVTLKSCLDESAQFGYSVLFRSNGTGNQTTFVQRELTSARVYDDMIMLKLAEEISKENDGVQYFNRFSTAKLDDGMADCKIIGFSPDAEPTEVGVDIKPTANCTDKGADEYMCFDTQGRGKVCKMDNGAPIICKRESTWYLVGFSSLSKGCTRENVRGYRTSFYKTKMQRVIDGKRKRGGDGICLTSGCYAAAQRIKSWIDTSVNPCDDFYNFACGNWIQKYGYGDDESSARSRYLKLVAELSRTLKSPARNRIESILIKENGQYNQQFEGDSSYISTTSLMYFQMFTVLDGILASPNKPSDPEAIVKARNLFRACEDTANINAMGLAPVHKYLEDMGGLPVLGEGPGGKWDQSSYTFEDLLVKTALDPIMLMILYNDIKNPRKHIIYVDQPNLILGNRNYYLRDRNDGVLTQYQTILRLMYEALGANSSDAETYAKEVVDFEIELANITNPAEERIDLTSVYNKMTLVDLSMLSGIDLKEVLKMLAQRGGITLEDDMSVVVLATEYFAKLGDVINNHEDRVVANYVVWKRALSKTDYLPDMFRYLTAAIEQLTTGTASNTPRWAFCVNTVNYDMKEPVGRMYVERMFKKEAKAKVSDSVHELVKAMKKIIQNAPWLSESTRQYAKKKLNYMSSKIGYPDTFYDDDWLNSVYENVTVFVDNPLFNAISLDENTLRQSFELQGQEIDKSIWTIPTAGVNAYYSPLNNGIIFLAGIMQSPFFADNQPSFLNFGAIGVVIGHEITHGFDSSGRHYDKNGKRKNWWTEDDSNRFIDRAQCLVDQYSNFTVPGTGGLKVNGQKTLGENIADNGGIKESFQAYRKWKKLRLGDTEDRLPGLDYTPYQMFFLSFAHAFCASATREDKIQQIQTSVHAYNMFRVIGSCQNSRHFSKAWNCPADSYMNPPKKCSVW